MISLMTLNNGSSSMFSAAADNYQYIGGISAVEVIRKIFTVGYSGIIVLFFCCAVALIFFAALELWHGINPNAVLPLRDAVQFCP